LDYLKEQFYDILRKGQFTTKWSKENRNISTNRVFQTTNKQTCSTKLLFSPTQVRSLYWLSTKILNTKCIEGFTFHYSCLL
jgi:hypothetical protein